MNKILTPSSPQKRGKTHPKTRGFTLIELMITLAVIGILAAVVVPAYQDSVRKSRRADAQGALTSFANAMERHFTTNSTYGGAAAGGADTGLPAIFSTQSPIDGGTAYYVLRITAADASSFTLRATPTNGQVGDGLMELDHTGARRWDENNDGDFVDTGETDWEKN